MSAVSAACPPVQRYRRDCASSPESMRNISVRPAPTRPKKPRISPFSTETSRAPQTGADQTGRRAGLAPVLTRPIVINVLNVAPDHAGHQSIMVQIGHVLEGAHEASVLEHGHGVTHAEDFFHAMGNVENDPALVTQPGDDCHQTIDLARRQTAGGFVERDDMGIARHGLGNFHQLPLPEGKIDPDAYSGRSRRPGL